MSESVSLAPSSSPGALPPITVTAPRADEPSAFRQLVSELNPLQYIPVVGTIYRAVTGDTIPETARDVGSLVVSGLIGGPIGVASNAGLLALEKVTGIDPDKIGTDVLASIGIGGRDPAPAAVAASTPATGTTAPAPVVAAADPVAWSPAQLAAYGVSTNAKGELVHGALRGADVLNDLELARLAATGSPPPTA